MSKNLLTIITPCLNIIKTGRKDIFDKMMESIHTQSYKNIEHIVIDGGSTDDTLLLLDKYKTKGWIDKLLSENNNGIYEAMSKGIRLAKGKYINIMNTDDYFTDNDFFRRAIDILDTKKFDFIHGDRIIQSQKNNKLSIKKGNILTAFYRMPFRHQTMIVNRNVFDEIGIFDQKYKIAADYKWVLKLLLANKKGYYIPEIFVYSLDGGASSDRERCIEEVSIILYETYGSKFNLTLEDCRQIYLRNLNLKFLLKILYKIKSWQIRKSLIHCFIKKS